MTFFGEIVEPSTRALIDDESEELPEYVPPNVTWVGLSEPPHPINTLLFVESQNIIKLVRLGVLPENVAVAKIKSAGIEIYQFKQNYLAVFSGSTLLFGEIVQIISPWIQKANNVYCITSSAITLYQNDLISQKPEALTKCLTNSASVPFDFCTKLEPPNLVTGLGATVLSYCVHNSLEASLFVVYLDNSPLDSLNSKSVVDLLRKMQFPYQSVNLMNSIVSNNLYM